MKRISELSAFPGIICLVSLMFWGEQIKDFSIFLYVAMIAILVVGFVSGQIQVRRDREKSIAHDAVASYKKESGIAS